MIPKIIHWCWLSDDQYPEKIQKCLNSWKEKLSDYKIILWNCDNFDINKLPWLKKAYNARQYAFVSDYIRCYCLYEYGGIYLDSDIEIKKKFDNILDCKSFIGFEYTGMIEAAVVGAEKGCKWIKNCCEWYESSKYMNFDNETRIIAPLVMQLCYESTYNIKLIDKGVVVENNKNMIYPYNYFSPKNLYNEKINDDEKTYCIHHFNASWYELSISIKFKHLIHVLMIKTLGKKIYNYIIYTIRKRKLKKITIK